MKRLSPWLFGSGLSLWLLGCAPAHLAPPGEEATVDSSSGEARANKRRSQKQGLGGARLLGLDGDDQNVAIDPHGFVVLDQTKTDFNFLWVANKDDWDTGSVSKLDQRTHKEVARYFSVTCFGLPDGGRQACSGFSGCCSVDDDARWELRRRNADFSNLPHQEVQRRQNHPSRTALAFDGSVFVANRAFGGQGSLTHIANDPATCDPNHNHAAGLQTSSDLNGDGVIETDCNRNGLPDDLADTSPQNPQGGPCTGGR